MYSGRFNLLFIHIPKTAGQSIAKHFMQIEGIPWEHRRDYLMFPNGDPRHGPPQVAHFTLEEYYMTDLIPNDVIDRAIKFTVIRNPWARLWSEYNYHWAHICSWDRFFDYFPDMIFDDHKTGRDALRHIKPQNEFLAEGIEILRFERLTEDFAAFCRRHNLPNRGLPTENGSGKSGAYREMFDGAKADAVFDFYHEDIKRFGYKL